MTGLRAEAIVLDCRTRGGSAVAASVALSGSLARGALTAEVPVLEKVAILVHYNWSSGATCVNVLVWQVSQIAP
jgi:uncharacterized membrane protein YjfL (UPF0719 family)